MYFDRDYREVATLRDGTQVALRLIRPDDRDRLRRGFLRLSPESRYRRFFSVKLDLSPDELTYLCDVDQVKHFALGAVTADGDEGLGVARFVALAGEPGVAEAAIAVVDEMQGQGLGGLLFQRLMAAARERGVTRIRCDMLGSNQGMAELIRHLAPAATVAVSSGVVQMEFALPPLGPEHPAAEPPRDTGLYRLLGLVARGAVEWTARWLRLLGGDLEGDPMDGTSVDDEPEPGGPAA